LQQIDMLQQTTRMAYQSADCFPFYERASSPRLGCWI